jgi:hypothetical protein
MTKIAIAAIAPMVTVLSVAPFSYASHISWNNLKTQTDNGVPFVSGGVGIEERAALRTVGEKDNLELSFALQNKEYIGGADVLIKDEKGKQILDAESNGPLFYTKLPEGKYTVMATAGGKKLSQIVQVPSKGQAHLYFAWTQAESARTLAQK